MTSLPKRQRNLSHWERFWLILFVVTNVGVYLYLVLTPDNILLYWFHIDDAFYYYQVAANITQGTGVTFDGITPTNGFHPLWLLVNIPVFTLKGINPMLPLRIIVVIAGFLNLTTGILLFRGARRLFTPWVASLMATVWMFSPAIFNRMTVGGMETGLNAAFLAWLWERITFYQVTQHWERLARRGWILGVISGLAILSRLDSVFVVGALWLWITWKIIVYYGWRQWQQWASVLARAAMPAGVLVGDYLLWSQWYVGHWYPISAAVKHWWGTRGDTVYGPPHQPRWIDSVRWIRTISFWWANEWIERVRRILGWTLGTSADRLRWALVVWAGLLALGGQAFKRNFLQAMVGIWLLAALTHAAYYEIVPYAGERDWYWVQETLGSVLLMGALTDAWWHRMTKKRPLPHVVAIIGTLIVFAGSWTHLQTIRHAYPMQSPAHEHIYLTTTHWLENHTAPNTRIGMTGAGATGYFIHNRTIEPLDGLINGYAYFNALQTGNAAEYLAAIGMDYVFAKDFVQTEAPYAKIFENRLQLIADCQCASGDTTTHLWRFLAPPP